MGVTWIGLDELRRALAALPQTTTTAAAPLTEAAAQEAADAMRAAYPVRTGRLRAGVVVEPRAGSATRVHWAVTNRTPYAWFFEYGTAHTPAGKVFVPAAQRARRRMYAAVIQSLYDQGATRVTGDRP
jgi:HK97 gp10 family phage protein